MSRQRRQRDHEGQRRALAHSLGLQLAVCILTVAALLGPAAGTCFAKSGSVPVDPPSDPSTVVFTLSLAGRSYEYTWADVSGSGTLGDAVTQSYLLDTAEQDPEEWTGVWLRTVLADVERRSGMTLDDRWKLRVTAVDSYVCSLVVSDVRDSQANYLLATDPARGCDTEDPAQASVWFDPTYVRICTNGDYGNTAYPARLVSTSGSLTVLDAAGNPIPAPTSAHDPIGVIVTGDAVDAPMAMRTYSGDAFWLTEEELAELKESRGGAGSHGGLWRTFTYSFCENHGTPVYGFTVGSGIGLTSLLSAAGVDDADLAALNAVTVTSAVDGYSTTFDINQPRYRFLTPEAGSGDAVAPVLALYRDEADAYGDLPAEATTAVADHTTFLYGQVTGSESNRCSFVSGASLVSLPAVLPAFMVDAPDAYSDDLAARQKTSYTLATLVSQGNERRTYRVGGSAYVCDGIDLSTVLAGARGEICPQDKLTVVARGGSVDPGLEVADVVKGTYLLAYYSERASGAAVANDTQAMIYGDGVAIADVLSLKVDHVDATAQLVVTSPTASQTRATVVKGARLALRAVTTKAPHAAAPDPVTWTSSSAKVATVTAGGTVTARGLGSTTIRATSGSCAVSFTVKVVARPVNATRITLPTARSLAVGNTITLVPTVYPKGATTTITWMSSNSAVARVDRSGRVTAAKGGKATIAVRTSSGKTARCVVTVR